MNRTQELTPQQHYAKRRFEEAQQRLLLAINQKVEAPHHEVVALRSALASAQLQCKELGLEIETLYEASGRLNRETEAALKAFADAQGQIKPVFPRKARIVVAGFLAFSLALINHDLPPAFNLLGSMACYFMLNHWLGVLFPTPGIRVARKAVECGLSKQQFWPKGTDAHADYRWTCFFARLHGKRAILIRTR
ncbi:hypothetical protein [Pseudomonas savastanoi]|uniref:hypothetical protein n=1 Tax=Pseudomonas savastanoi TaxID=29438 RepID=UPI000E329A7C|nr:hypothetical protein [Pseudomonas savastanoi]